MAAKLACAAETVIQFSQELRAQRTMLERVNAVTLGVFVSVEVMLEWAIVPFDQCRVIAFQPTFGVLLGKRPAHDVEAFVDDFTVWQDKHGNRPFG